MSSIPESAIASLIKSAVAQTLAAVGSQKLAYTIDEAAEAVGLPRNTLRDRVSSGEIKSVKRAGRWLILKEDLLKWLADS